MFYKTELHNQSERNEFPFVPYINRERSKEWLIRIQHYKYQLITQKHYEFRLEISWIEMVQRKMKDEVGLVRLDK